MRAILAVAGLTLAGSALAPSAGADPLVVSVSTDRVAITSTYTGASVVVFGVVGPEVMGPEVMGPEPMGAEPGGTRPETPAVVITVRGPRQRLVLRAKERLGPIWINRQQQKLVEVPSYLAVLASRPVAEVTGEGRRRRLGVGLDAVVAGRDFEPWHGTADDAFRRALVRLRAEDELYLQDEAGVAFLAPNVFRSAVPLPAAAPPGLYDVDVALFRGDGTLTARAQTLFELYKTGFEQRVVDWAQGWSALYGAGVGAMALAFGWLASVVFRRD